MRIIAAPNGFKGSLDGFQAAEAIARGIARVSPAIEVDSCPVTDGGDGLMEILTRALSGETGSVVVADPLWRDIVAQYGYIPGINAAIVEMAKASGLVLLPAEQRNPLKTTTFGTGQLLKNCLDLDVSRIILGLGGSATCDGGIGAAAALGYRFLDCRGAEIEPVGENLIHITAIENSAVDSRLNDIVIEAVCDVTNPLTGLEGASYIYSPQKGADLEQVKVLDEGLCNLARVIKKDLGIDVTGLKGGGAAGGLGAGVYAFFGGRLQKGIDLVLDILGFTERLAGADLVITGEGRIDAQTQFDKAPAGVARAAQQAGVPCVAVCGAIGSGIEELHHCGIDAVFSICNEPLHENRAMSEAAVLLENTAEQVVRLFLKARN
ncbi:MAG: glycerate kinase [Desulfopila sp.]|jgi:glycerate kinase|nr:glycerate kinase [Desulfopila sp.]